MKTKNQTLRCFQLIQHFGGNSQYDILVAVSHDHAKLVRALPAVNRKGWKVLTPRQAQTPELQDGNYFAIVPVLYL